jgi:hypothetical protein
MLVFVYISSEANNGSCRKHCRKASRFMDLEKNVEYLGTW